MVEGGQLVLKELARNKLHSIKFMLTTVMIVMMMRRRIMIEWWHAAVTK